jgi:hypothetical protein
MHTKGEKMRGTWKRQRRGLAHQNETRRRTGSVEKNRWYMKGKLEEIEASIISGF